MLLTKNKVIVAVAGSRKTTSIVEKALSTSSSKNLLITTYTNENIEQINSYLIQQNGYVPANIIVASWYSFLLQDGVRPYQNYMTNKGRINSINFTSTPTPYTAKESSNYYITEENNIYCDRVADFICECNKRSKGLIVKRLEKIYTHILVDEIQDFSGFDLEFLEKLFYSSISITAVGDPRQATFSTNNSLKNKQYRKSQILEWIKDKHTSNLFVIEERTDCYRSNQVICDFADALFPKQPKTNSKNISVTGHDGIFYIEKSEALDYFKKYSPTILRYDKRTNTLNLPAFNIGTTKGRTYDRVLIFPTNKMREYLLTKDLLKAGDLAKFYVAITRAKYSVAFVVN